MAQHTRRRPIVSREDPWRWLTFSSFWGGIYYLLAYVGLVAGHKTKSPQINRQAALVSFLVHMVTFVLGGTLFSLLEQRIVRRSAKEQSREIIASGLLEPSIPLQTLGGAAGSVVPFGLVIASNMVAERITGKPVFSPGLVEWPRAVAVTSVLSGFATLAVTRIAAWVAKDAQAVERRKEQ